jgi:hypothetical protein
MQRDETAQAGRSAGPTNLALDAEHSYGSTAYTL